MSRYRIIFAGTAPVAADTLSAVVSAATAADLEIAAVLTRPDAPQGRKRQLTPSPVARRAMDYGLPLIKASRVDAEVTAELAKIRADLGVVVAYGALLPAEALAATSRGWINLHFSDLPAYRGAAPVQHAILHAETTTAVSIFQLTPGMDTGPVFARAHEPIPEGASSGDMLLRLGHLGQDLLLSTLPGVLEGSLVAQPQTGTASYAPKLGSADAFIDPEKPAREVISRINATIPEPGAWTLYQQQRIKFGPVRPFSIREAGSTEHPDSDDQDYHHQQLITAHPAGAVISLDTKQGLQAVLIAGDGGLIQLSELQPAGKKPMSAPDWLRGQQQTPILGT